MKRIIYKLTILVLVVLAGCELEPQVQLGGEPTPPAILIPTSGQAYNFTWDDNEDSLMVVFTEIDYGFPIAITYTAEFDNRGGDFSRSRKLGFFTNDTLMIPIKKINSEVKKLKHEDSEGNSVAYKDGDVAELDFRISGHISDAVDDVVSAVVPFSFVPYSEPVIVDPVDTTDVGGDGPTDLYLIGASTGAWDTERAVALTAGDNGVFTGLVHFNADESGRNFRFFTDKDWGASYGGYDVFETYPTDLLAPAETDSDPNFNFVGETGWYNLTVDTKNNTIAMVAADAPELYLTGDATHGWSWDEPVTTIYGTDNYIYEGDVDFIQNNAFRIFTAKNWDDPSYGWDYLTNYDTSVIDVMEGHADPNWQFLLESGTYHVKVDLIALSVEITQ